MDITLASIIASLALGLSLYNKNSQDKKQAFKIHIEETYYSFENIHNMYLEAFQNYRNKIISSNNFFNIIDEIFNDIWEDYLFSEGNRSKLRNLANQFTSKAEYEKALEIKYNISIPSYRPHQIKFQQKPLNNKLVINYLFFYEIYEYLTNIESNLQSSEGKIYNTFFSNNLFRGFDLELRELISLYKPKKNYKKFFSNQRKKELKETTILIVDRIVAESQKKYITISNYYLKIKKDTYSEI